MSRLNFKKKPIYTHNGAKAKHLTPEQALSRSVLSCMLWENEFYEDGISIAERISTLVSKARPEFVASCAIFARNKMKLRHVPLWIACNMCKASSAHKILVSKVLYEIVQRPDELTEFLAMYWKNGKVPIANQVKKGLATAFTKFNAYQLAKYNRNTEIKLKDIMFLCHPKPRNKEQEEIWKQLIDGTIAIPDTWEVAISNNSNDKKSEWSRLLKDNKLGAMALLRNLRNMLKVGVDEQLIKDSLLNINTKYILPYRFISAARYAPNLEPELEVSMLKCLKEKEIFPGKSVILVDVSGSMSSYISNGNINSNNGSEMTRLDAACGLAILLREICENVRIYTFSSKLVEIAPRSGFALRDAIERSQNHSSTYLGSSVRAIYSKSNIRTKGRFKGHLTFEGQCLKPDRLIVITDEQSDDPVPNPLSTGYMINVASNSNGVGYGAWLHCDGWSEAILDWIIEYEKSDFMSSK